MNSPVSLESMTPAPVVFPAVPGAENLLALWFWIFLPALLGVYLCYQQQRRRAAKSDRRFQRLHAGRPQDAAPRLVFRKAIPRTALRRPVGMFPGRPVELSAGVTAPIFLPGSTGPVP